MDSRNAIVALAAGVLVAAAPTTAMGEEPSTVSLSPAAAAKVFAAAAPQFTGDSAAVPTFRDGQTTANVGDGVRIRVPDNATRPVTLTDESGNVLSVKLPFAESAGLTGTYAGPVYDNSNGTHTVPVIQKDGSLVIGTVIEDISSPVEYRYEISVPAGGTLADVGEGAAVLDAQGRFVAGIAAPWAKDASGRAVATRYDVQGHDLVQIVEHRAEGLTYPISADPWWGIDLFDWTARKDCSGKVTSGHCVKGKSGYVISAGLSKWGISWRYSASGYGILNGSGWEELVAKRPAADNYNNRMRPQWTCHAVGAYPPLTGGPSWDIESWRPENWTWSVWVNERCNW